MSSKHEHRRLAPRAAARRGWLRCARAGVAGLLAALAAANGSSAPAEPTDEARAFVDRVVATWSAGQVDGWLALWSFEDGAVRESEEAEARLAFQADETTMSPLRPPVLTADGSRLSADVQVFVADEPRGRVAYWRLVAERRAEGFVLVGREISNQVDGLVHLTLAEEAFQVRDVDLSFEDFSLHLRDGTLFTSGEQVGRTAVVFVGDARVRFEPRPRSEREQLRQFAGAPALDLPVDWVFVRIPPADFDQLFATASLQLERHPLRHRARAEEVFRQRSSRSYLLDAALRRSPWWLHPSAGDAIVDFPWRRGRVLTYARASGESEEVNLFERDRQLQICSYASSSRITAAGSDERRTGPVDVIDQSLTVRFEPERREISAVHVMRLRMLTGNPTLRLRLDDDLAVSSVTTGEGSSLLFFRVRDQDAMVVSLGSLGASGEPLTLVTRFSGRHDPAVVDQEVLQLTEVRSESDNVFVPEPPIVYANRTAWYPRTATEDFSTASLFFDVPAGWLAVTGGEQRSLRSEGRRTRTEYRLDQPGKFVTAVVGRLSDIGLRQLGRQAIRGYAMPRTRSETEAHVQAAEEMLAFYARLFGPCPYPSIGLVVAEATTPGGHSPPGLAYLQQRPATLLRRSLPEDPGNFSDLPGFFLAHELAHQWWGQGTAPASYRERWLSEAWAQYAAALWIRERVGESAFRRMMDRMATWAWRHDGEGPIHLGQRLGSLKREPRIFRAVVYAKGAWVVHMLRGILGDEAFFAGARAYLEKHRFARADSLDLRRALEQASGRDLRPYFERWIEDTGLPRLRWQSDAQAVEGGFRTRVTVHAEHLPGPVPLEISLATADSDRKERVVLPPEGGSWSFTTRLRPRVSLNEDRGLLARIERGRGRHD